MENSQMSLIEIALKLMEEKDSKINIYTLIQECLAAKGIEDTDGSYTARLYVDITTSSKFVYMGNDEWDLKVRQSLDMFDKDGSAFISKEDEYEDDEDDTIQASDFDSEYDEPAADEDEEEDDNLDIDDEDEEDEDDTRDDYIDDEDEDDLDSDDEYDDDADLDEDKYNDIMDDYEDLYDN